jgi:predicted amidohydrolase
MREPLVIAVAQPQCVPLDVAANAVTHAATVRSARARVVVFPELSLTGYELAAPAVSIDDLRLAPIVEACAAAGSLALVGAPVEGDAAPTYIAMLAIDGSGATVVYRKMWLGGAEPGRFSPGDTPAVLEVDGWRLGLAICKDTGVPQHASDTAALGMDAYVAGVLESEEDVAVPDERARRVAAAHRVWVAVASFAGSTGGGYDRAAGGSGIWTSHGVGIAQAGSRTGAVARATLSLDRSDSKPGSPRHSSLGCSAAVSCCRSCAEASEDAKPRPSPTGACP